MCTVIYNIVPNILQATQYNADRTATTAANRNYKYSETSLIRHSMGPENNVGLGGCWIIECLLPYLCMVAVPQKMVGLDRMLDYRGVRSERFYCSYVVFTSFSSALLVFSISIVSCSSF